MDMVTKSIFLFFITLLTITRCEREKIVDVALDDEDITTSGIVKISTSTTISDFEDNDMYVDLYNIAGISESEKGMLYTETSGKLNASTINPLAGIRNYLDTGDYGTVVYNDAGNNVAHFECTNKKSDADTDYCQSIFGFCFYINKEGTIGANIGDHECVDLTELRGISYCIKGDLGGAKLYLVLLSTNIEDWSHWQVDITNTFSSGWTTVTNTWEDFNNAGWGEGVNYSMEENLKEVEGFKFVIKNETVETVSLVSELFIDNIKLHK